MISQTEMIRKSLNGDWKFREATKETWLPATVPGTVHTDLLALDSIGDPYYRLNEKDLQWIDKRDWEYQHEFMISQDVVFKKQIFLKFYGLDTYARVRLNGQPVLSADNMFRIWEVNVKPWLKEGKNILTVYFDSPIKQGLEKLERHGYGLPASNDQSENGELGDKKVSIFTRKAGYHYGWDWGPRLVTSGIWRNVELIAFDAARLTDVYIIQEDLKPEMARLNAQVELEASAETEAELMIAVNNKEVVRKRISCKQGRQTFNIPFNINNPERWWPNGLGDQIIYDVLVQVEQDDRILDRKYHGIGLRTIEVGQPDDPDGMGKGFYFKVNGRPVFAKGANYIPNDLFLPRVSDKTYESMLGSAREANMNMIRVWGGGIYENDYFYQLCDKLGLMVWQDFMFACSMYPGDVSFLENVRQEAIDNVKRLRNHASIALWCGNNEIETAWGEYEENAGWGWKQQYDTDQRKAIWSDYEKVFHNILPEVVNEFASGTFYWKSSPTAGDRMLSNYQSRSGDMHYWGVWHAKHPFTDFDRYVGRFMSEYGFQSFPVFSSVKKYTTEEDWHIESEVMSSHQRSGIGNLRIKEYMEQDYLVPDNFEELLYVGQLLQGNGIRYAIEAHRKNMPYCMGSLYWQLNDCWPVASWSGIDYYGNWKALHYNAKDAFKNEILSIWKEEDKIKIYAISDLEENREVRISCQLQDFSGKELWKEERKFSLKGNRSEVVFEINEIDLLGGHPKTRVLLVVRLEDQSGNLIDRALFEFMPPKDLILQKPALHSSWSGNILSLSTDTYTKGIYLELPVSEGRFSDNFFDLLPGEKKVVSWIGQDGPRDELKITHLQKTMQ